MINIAVITDIHGNRPVLATVLRDLSSRRVDHIYCLGDVVGIGPDSNEVLEMLLSRTDISFVIGNHDMAVISAFRGDEPLKGHQKERQHHQWLADRIRPEFVEAMSTWPKRISVNYFKKPFLFCHYHLIPDLWFMSIDSNPSVQSLEQIYKETEYQAICFGHHHVIHHFVSKGRVYFSRAGACSVP